MSGIEQGNGGRSDGLIVGLWTQPGLGRTPVTLIVGDEVVINAFLVGSGTLPRPARDCDLFQVTLALPDDTCTAEDDVDPDCVRHEPPEPTDDQILALLPALREARNWEYGYVEGMDTSNNHWLSDHILVNLARAMLRTMRTPKSPAAGLVESAAARTAALLERHRGDEGNGQ